jgi:hypothetical protein
VAKYFAAHDSTESNGANMNINKTNIMTRRQVLFAIAAGAVGFASSTVFAKQQSNTKKIKSYAVMEPEIIENNSIKSFVMSF